MLWWTIEFFPAYEVSEFGDVRRILPAHGATVGAVIKPKPHKFGYPRYKLRMNGREVGIEAHRLVALAFLGQPPFPKAEVAHGDGDPLNNHYSNLRWSTHKDNEKDKVAHGTAPIGAKNGMAKLTSNKVAEIRAKRVEGQTLAAIASQYGVTFQAISKIVRGDRW